MPPFIGAAAPLLILFPLLDASVIGVSIPDIDMDMDASDADASGLKLGEAAAKALLCLPPPRCAKEAPVIFTDIGV